MDYVVLDSDQALFDGAFGPATVVVQPGTLTATGPATVGGKKMAIVGDEGSVRVPGCTYTTPAFSIAGAGTLEIAALNGDQQATKTASGGTKLVLVGSKFTARFTVSAPAQQPAPPGPNLTDPVPTYTGTGAFQTTNTKFRGT